MLWTTNGQPTTIATVPDNTAVVDGRTVELHAGDLLAVEPGETHTFVASSEDYLHFVIQAPFAAGDKRT